MATWLWNDGHRKRVIGDAGGWALRSRKDAVDVYFRTEPLKLVYALSALGEGRRRELAKLKALQREGGCT
jgi:hypothetical protein